MFSSYLQALPKYIIMKWLYMPVYLQLSVTIISSAKENHVI
jgi:hypothetical protein